MLLRSLRYSVLTLSRSLSSLSRLSGSLGVGLSLGLLGLLFLLLLSLLLLAEEGSEEAGALARLRAALGGLVLVLLVLGVLLRRSGLLLGLLLSLFLVLSGLLSGLSASGLVWKLLAQNHLGLGNWHLLSFSSSAL